jgi:DNA-binding LytR/AlgR family response regulator
MEYVLRYADQSMLDFHVDEFQTGTELMQAFQKSDYKIVFLDILMDGISGVETAYKIRETDSECVIVFTTTSPDFRAEGFDVGAIHYLLKPFTFEAVTKALDRCKRLFAASERYFCVIANRQSVKVRFQDVLYVEVYGKCTLIHTINDTIKTYTPISKIALLLREGPFLACHRCYIVNMRYISGILDDCFELDNEKKIPIRRKGRQAIKDEYKRYFINSIRSLGDGQSFAAACWHLCEYCALCFPVLLSFHGSAEDFGQKASCHCLSG